MIFNGKAIKYGDNVDTDVIIPARYLNTSDHKELASHCMEDIDKDFTKKVENGDIMIAGFNFGCGSSREHAPIAIKASGISLVIARSFARIFYRNSINIGLAIWNATKRWTGFRTVTKWKRTWITALSTTARRARVLKRSLSPNLSKKLSQTADL